MTGSVAARTAKGLAARKDVPLDALMLMPQDGDRLDPVEVLAAQDDARVPELVPIRYGRMLASPFAFFRGAASVMAADLAVSPCSGLTCQLSGDAHIGNFGVFASPERRLVFDLNDFDETLPGPWEWDVKRLAASLAVAGRQIGLGRKARENVVRAAAGRYRSAMARFAEQGDLEVWYTHAAAEDVKILLKAHADKAKQHRFAREQAKARARDSLQAYRKLTSVVGGRRRITADPPLLVPVGDLLPDTDREDLEFLIQDLLASYATTLSPDRRHLLSGFRFVDMARKVVGVGSVGTRCWIVLLHGRDENDPLLLQVKEASRSVLADHLPGRPRAHHRSEGERVVAGQRLMQAVGDIFLGWETAEGIDGLTRDFYVRQLRDWKGSASVETMDEAGLRLYGGLCGWTLARAHARTGDRIAMAAYLDGGKAFDVALAEFAESYADRNEQDYRLLAQAARTGRISVQSGL
ncbi:DUF2252 domain-containing protein [Lentzea sp. BCCO 10_0798]|uniref:DUF2252 domain-containing protein n=1 Tax=Lentzea kristufekii TaxID=3095430 RepID=A0ABU4TR59_9PSEU|nr:DUF2252 domain-containing protein [Lentzea sp. BCCO 10_0798]MDX8050768.1 DUF2252 domain-containing protein [Lentzea sp. BCCO 10_0798]